jgi:hypothetical protein
MKKKNEPKKQNWRTLIENVQQVVHDNRIKSEKVFNEEAVATVWV